MTMPILTNTEREELYALREVNDVTKRPSFIMRFHWHESGYASLVRRGLVKWGNPPKGFDKRKFAGTRITKAGRAILALTEDSHG